MKKSIKQDCEQRHPTLLAGFLWLFLLSCSPINTTASSPGADQKGLPSDDANAKKFMPGTPAVESTLALPEWCNMDRSNGEVRFKCSRIDSGVNLIYEGRFTAAKSFNPSNDCWFVDEVTKKINCRGTLTGETFIMDVSTAREKVTESLPAVLIAINFAVSSKYEANSDAVRFTSDVTSFFGSRIQQLMRREGLAGIAGDLGMLVNKYIPSGLTAVQAAAFQLVAYQAFDIMVTELSGKKDYDLAGVVLRGLELSRALPPEILGEQRNSLTGTHVAKLLSSNDAVALERFFKIISPGVSGVSSQERFLAGLREAP
jgi:hypothetical protein